MDGTPLDVPCTLFDFLRRRAAPPRQRRVGRRLPNAGAKAGAPGGVARPRRDYPLVDNLSFRVRLRPSAPASTAAAVAERFTAAFAAVWGHVPETDRRLLLRYWQGEPGATARGGTPPRPVIRVVAGSAPSDPSCDLLGHRLTFAAPLVTERPHDLPLVIARALAEAHRFASRRHWGLILEEIEQPMLRWERRRGRKTDADREAKLDELEADYLSAYESEVADILRDWGVGPDVAGEDQ